MVAATPRPWWRVPLYPATFGVAFVLLTWSGAGLVPALALRPLLFSILLATAASLAFAALLDDPDRGGLLSGVLMLILVTSDDLLAIVLGAAGLIIVVEGIARRGRPTLVAVPATNCPPSSASSCLR